MMIDVEIELNNLLSKALAENQQLALDTINEMGPILFRQGEGRSNAFIMAVLENFYHTSCENAKVPPVMMIIHLTTIIELLLMTYKDDPSVKQYRRDKMASLIARL